MTSSVVWMLKHLIRLSALLAILAASSCSSSESDADATTSTTAATAATEDTPDEEASTVETAESAEATETTLASLEPASLEEVLPVVCDFERYNGLRILANGTDENPAGYEQELDTFVRLIFGDRSLPTDEASVEAINAEQARCGALPSLTFANGAHPVGSQIEAATYRTIVPTREDCSWQLEDADGEVSQDVDVPQGSDVEIVISPTDQYVHIDRCGIFVTGEVRTEAQ